MGEKKLGGERAGGTERERESGSTREKERAGEIDRE